MKKNILFFVILCPLMGLKGSFGQIFSNRILDKNITIMPIGISDRIFTASSTNTALGEQVLYNAFDVTNNTGVGNEALANIGTNFPNNFNGNNNTGVGDNALFANAQGYDNVAFGNSAMGGSNAFVSNNNNNAFGKNALYSISSGSNNVAFGQAVLTNNSTGSNNSAFGLLSLTVNQSSNNHLAFGASSLQNHFNNDNSTAVGTSALYFDQSGIDNVALGAGSLTKSISCSSNTAVGWASLSSNKTGFSNIGLGVAAMSFNEGQNNTVLGFYSFDQNTTGSNNVALGFNALHFNLTGSGNVAVGTSAGYNETGSNKLYIDNAITPFTAHIPVIGGDFTAKKVCIACHMTNTGVNDFTTRSETFQVTGNAFKTLGSGSWIFPSDRRLKTNIVSLNADEILAKVLLMQGVNYDLIANPEQGIQYGFIAQDLRKIFPTKVYENKVGYLSSSYGDFVPMFIEALKALNERVKLLEENKFDVKVVTAKVEEMERKFK